MSLTKCVRCGVCCVECLCCVGQSDKEGNCMFLTFDSEKTTCQLIARGLMPEGAVNRDGCLIRTAFEGSLPGHFELLFENPLEYINKRKSEND